MSIQRLQEGNPGTVRLSTASPGPAPSYNHTAAIYHISSYLLELPVPISAAVSLTNLPVDCVAMLVLAG